MHHMRALCDVLEINLDEATGGKPRQPRTAIEQAFMAELQAMTPEDAEMLLLQAKHMNRRAGRPS